MESAGQVRTAAVNLETFGVRTMHLKVSYKKVGNSGTGFLVQR